MNMMRTTCLILCAGESSRMGQPKALLQWKNKSFIAHAVESAREAGISEIIAVVGCHYQDLASELLKLHVKQTLNLQWQKGMGSSFKVGLASVLQETPEVENILVLVSDQPLVNGHSLKKILSSAKANPEKIIAAEYNHSLGVPALFPKIFFSDLLTLEDQAGAKKLISNNISKTVGVPLPEASKDVDTQAEYQALLGLK